MPIKLLPQIRFLSPSLPVTRFPTMKPGFPVHSYRSMPILCRLFPFRLKYLALSTRADQQLGVRRLSTRPFRPRVGSSSEFTRNGERGEVRTSKSLIEDEAELSDWVSELKTDSFRGKLTSDDEELDLDRARNRARSRDRDSYRDSDRDRSRSRESFPIKRRRESDSDLIGNSNRRRTRDSVESFSRNSRFSKRLDSEDDDGDKEGGSFSHRKHRGNQGKNGNSFMMKRNVRNSDSVESFSRNSRFSKRFDSEDDDGDKEERSFSRRNNRGNQGNNGNSFMMKRNERNSDSVESFSRNSRFSKRFDSEDDDGDKEEISFSHRINRGNQGKNGNSLIMKRNERNLDSGFRRDRAKDEGLRKGGKDLRAGARLMKEEDDNDDFDEETGKAMGGIGDLLSEESSVEDEDDVVLTKQVSTVLGFDKEVIEKDGSRSSPGKSDSYLSETRFDQCSVSPLSLKGIKEAGYEKMTVVQEATLPVILKGKDVLAKAKTGTGKTVAFLLPSIESVIKSPPVSCDNKRPPILVLVICPTRELASQAAGEANTLLKYHPSIGVQVVIGGTRPALEQKRMQANPCQILVATPGRLRDHIENTAGFATRLMGVKVLVLDEADHLLDMGFRKDIEKIIAAVPKQRQTLLFSATVPEEVRQICHVALKRDHEFINTVQEGSGETHSQVRQMHMVAPLDKHFSSLYVLLKEHIADDADYKVLVFCTTAMVTRLVASLLGELNLNVREIHSRKPQSYRTRISDEFRKSKGLILVTSDVSARGVDYPDVTLVIQLGLPADREQYIHRLGRTGRKGKEGQGILLLAPWEEFFLSAIKDFPVAKAPLPSVDPDTKKKVERGLSQVEMKNKEAAYQAWLGFYNSNKTVARDKHRLVELANEFSRSMGLDNPPPIPKLVLGKMGLRNIPGLRSK